jgi:hypothetical protein
MNNRDTKGHEGTPGITALVMLVSLVKVSRAIVGKLLSL